MNSKHSLNINFPSLNFVFSLRIIDEFEKLLYFTLTPTFLK